MKKLFPWSICIVLGGSLMAASDTPDKKTTPSPIPADAPAVQLVFEMADGTRVTGTPAADRFKITTQYAKAEVAWSHLLTVEFSGTDHAIEADLQNGDKLSGKFSAKEIAVKTGSDPVAVPVAQVNKVLVRIGSIGGDYVNSLGMEFIAVPGVKGLFGIWDTRVQDYRAYAEASPGVNGDWKKPGFKQGEDHPVVRVNWADAKAFCAWLTQKERTEGKITIDQEYRLPTDKEWSVAVGAGKYPWGDAWPPPEGAGNYSQNYQTDNFTQTSPVGSFKANAYELYDMGGNVWQWCESWYRSDMNDPSVSGSLTWLNDDGGGEKYRVVRGASWSDKADPFYFSSSFRDRVNPGERKNNFGFRCVLAPVSTATAPH